MHLIYNALDRLVTVFKENTKAHYTYDHFHRRIKKETLVEGVSQQMQHYLYVDQDEIGSMEKGQITELRVLGEGEGAEIGSAIAIEVNGRILVPIHNMRGDLCCLIDSETKEILQNCHYSAFGEPSAESMIPWGFSSKRLDPETGFIYFGRRYYSPSLGRWITPDPIGFRDGPNLYAYVHNSPLIHFDLYGLEAASQLRDYRFNYSLSQYSPLNGQRWSSFGSNLNFRTPFAYDKFEYRSSNGSNYLTSAVKGCGHGALNFAVRSLQEFHRIGTHIGAEVMEASCHDKCNIFGSLERYQTNQLNVIGQYYRGIVSASPYDSVYQSYCSGTELTLEIGSLATLGYGAVKTGIGFVKIARNSIIENTRIIKANQIWSSTKTKTSVENAYHHWKNHGHEFPLLGNANQYIEAVKDFTNHPPFGTLTKIRSNGDVVLYNPNSNIFAVLNNQGLPKTMFKPDPLIHKYSTNLEYFYGQ